MSKKMIIILASIMLMLTAVGMPNFAYAKQYPCSELLLPYFEAPMDNPGLQTFFSVSNVTDQPVQVSFSVFSNWGVEVFESPTTLEPHAVYPVNLSDWIVDGKLPDRILNTAELEHVQAALSGQRSLITELFYSTEVAPGVAVGYVKIQTLGAPRPDALWGDFFVVEPSNDFAVGESLARICSPDDDLCDRHLMRFLEGGGFSDGGTRFVIWTGEEGRPSLDPLLGAPTQLAQLSAFDQDGNPLGNPSFDVIATQSVPFGVFYLPESFGWVTLTTENDSFVYFKYSAQDRYSVAFSAFCSEETGQEQDTIEIEKMTNGEDADSPPGPSLVVGSSVEWEYRVTNTGSVPLTGIEITDSDPDIQVSCPRDTLDPGESMICTAEGTAEECQYMNLGTVVGTAPDGSIVEDTDPSHYFGGSDIGIDLEKATDGVDADVAPGPVLTVGDSVIWTYEVTNTGNAPLTNITITDDQGVAVSCPRTALDPGESMTCTGTGFVQEGQYMNLGSAVGTGPCDREVSDVDPSHYFGEEPFIELPSIDIEKLTNGEDADFPSGRTLPSGTPVEWMYVVNNTGNVLLANVTITDDQGVGVSCPRTELAPGETMTCTAQGVAGRGLYRNVGTVTAISPNGTEVSDSDPSHYFGEVLGEEGCSQGYWKNHPGSWPSTGYSPGQTVASVFSQAAIYPELASATLLEALKFKGGNGSEGGARILLKQAVAALLNAAHPGVSYPLLGPEVINDVNAALASGDRAVMVSLAEALDLDNNLGCPLN